MSARSSVEEHEMDSKSQTTKESDNEDDSELENEGKKGKEKEIQRSNSTASRPSRFQNFINEVVEGANPPLRHLASKSSLGSISIAGSEARSPTFHSQRRAAFRNRLSTNLEEQRHPGKSDVRITRNTRLWDPDFREMESLNGAAVRFAGSKHLSVGSASDAEMSLAGARSSLNSTAVNSTAVPPGKEMYGRSTPDVGGTNRSSAGLNHYNEDGTVVVEEDDIEYPGPLKLTILVTGIALSVFLISLDRTIITTAIPFIVNEFDSYADVGWYGSAYLLTASAFQPLYGRIYLLFNMKWSYLTSLFLFEVGSLVCGIAPNSITLIIGRALAGLGSAGILTGSFVVVSHTVPLHKRPVLTAVVGLMFGVGATAGPLLGGVFTDLVTWRWCFYFNLPVGGATVFAMILFFHPPRQHTQHQTILDRILSLDIIGNIILLVAFIMLFLALQYTEQLYPWSSPRVIGLLAGSGVTFILFCVWQWWKADSALMPPRILCQRTVAASCAAAFFIYSAVLVHSYYLPQYFQAIKGVSAIHAGVNMIPYVAANALFSLFAGIFVSKNGYFVAPAIVGMVIGTIGSGFISTFGVDTSSAYWIGIEVLASAGIGMAIQQGFTAVQIVLPLEEVAIGTAAVVAFQSLGGAIFVSVGNTILQNSLQDAGNDFGVDIQAIIRAGASGFRSVVPADQLPVLLDVYAKALMKVFYAAIPTAGLAVFACAFMEWRGIGSGPNGNGKGDVENGGKSREEIEKRILEEHAKRDVQSRGTERRSQISGSTAVDTGDVVSVR